MSTASELLRLGKTEDTWQKYCGFLDLSIKEFMDIQRHLLTEQLELLSDCELGRKVMGRARPRTVEEFRQKAPFTTYEAYAPYLLERREDVLPEKPMFWQRTSGRSGEYRFKWVPVTERLYNEIGLYIVSWVIFASCTERGDIKYRDKDKLLYGMAPPPYPSGALARALHRELVLDVFPPMGEAEVMAFRQRMEEGFRTALSEGMDYQFGLASVLVSIGEQISQGMLGGTSLSFSQLRTPSQFKAIPRLARGLVKAKLARRPLLPKDLWKLKGLASGGSDSAVFRERIKYYWGRYPLESYGCAEAGLIAMQTWDYKDMTPLPTLSFLEFMPEEECLKLRQDPSYQPRTVLLNEVEAGQRYEVVFTSFHGCPFIRYRVGDMIQVNALRNEQLNINLPQIGFYARSDDIIDIGGFTRLTERVIGQAIENSGLAYAGWTARKEIVGDEPVLHLYIELKDYQGTFSDARYAIHRSLKELDLDYAALEDMLHFEPLRMTLLPEGAFPRYMLEQVAAGAEVAHLKPLQINAPDEVVERLLRTEE
ncbi:MAG: hypothetical protein AMJ37_03460 [Dehalococcoidia bacterium DG_18]|nr:MAG: hypothetical protein AMJ37_03460 [Dehalococcoidia bacterium DG_18]